MWNLFKKFTQCDIDIQEESSECSEVPLNEIIITEIIQSQQLRSYDTTSHLITALYVYHNSKKINDLAEIFKIILDIKCYPSGLLISSEELLTQLDKNYDKLKELASVHEYLGNKPLSRKFSIMVREPFAIYSEVKSNIISEGIDENGQTLLHHCVKHKNIAYLVYLLKIGFNPNKQDNQGKTPLFYTLNKAHKDGLAVTALMQYGADPNIRNLKGETYVERAVIKHNKHNLEIVKRLIR